MTDLTEQWKKGELEANKYYYVRDISYILPAHLGKYDNQLYFSGNEVGYGYEENKELEVLAPVPSFEEWEASYNCMAENEVLRLKNAQLKELLKKCRHIIGIEKDFATCHFEEYTFTELLDKIDGALK